MKFRKLCTLMLSMTAAFCSLCLPSESDSSLSRSVLKKANDQTEQVRYDSDDAEEINSIDNGFTATVASKSYTAHSQSFQIRFKSEGNGNYFFGYNGTGDEYRPLTATYNLVDKTTSEKKTVAEYLDPISVINVYDGLGPSLGQTNFTYNFDFVFDDNFTFEVDSLKLFNIYGLQENLSSGVAVDFSKCYQITSFTGMDSVKNVDIDAHFNASLERVGTFGSYVSFNVSFDNDAVELYKEQKSSIYKKNQEDIANGKIKLVTELPSVLNSYFRLEYENGEIIKVPVKQNSLTSMQTIADGHSSERYLLEDVELNGLKSFSLCGVSFRVQMYNVLTDGTTKVKNGTAFTARLGCIYFNPVNDTIASTNKRNVIVFIIVASLIYLVVIAGVIAGVYFYSKNRYKNDEFRRVNNRSFFKTASIFYVSGLIFLLDLLFIVFRSGVFDNTLTAFNPLDNFIVVLSVLMVFVIGFMVKYFINVFKNNRARKEAERLKLNEGADADDGTK